MASSSGFARPTGMRSARLLSEEEETDGSQAQLMSPAHLARPFRGKMVKRFFQSLVALSLLCKFPGDRIPAKDDLLETDKSSCTTHACRNFLYHLCIICDFQKGGDSVVSIALEATGNGTCFWVASNKGSLETSGKDGNVHTKIINFLSRTLSMMQEPLPRDNWPTAKRDLEKSMFRKFTDFAHQRLSASWVLLQKAITEEASRVRKLRCPNKSFQDEYIAWLQTFTSKTKPRNFESDCRHAYNQRKSRFIKRNVLREHDLVPKSDGDDPAFRVRHYVGRMGSTLRAAEFLAGIAATHPEFYANFKIKDCSAEPHKLQFLEYGEVDPDELAKDMLPAGSRDQARIVNALYRLDRTSNLLEDVRNHITSRNFRPRIHAECAVAEAVHAGRIRFFGNDRYIACSKPACFCCYHYLCNHPGRFVPPPCHNRVWPNWRAPDLVGRHDLVSRQQIQERVIEKVLVAINEALTRAISGKSASIGWHPDSTSGITTTASRRDDDASICVDLSISRRASNISLAD